jgi:lipopolysaccharide transport system permease protein
MIAAVSDGVPPATAAADAIDRPTTIIEPSRRFELPSVADVWANRDLLWLLAYRNVSVRYKETLLGVGWAILQPLLSMVVFTLLFGMLARLPSGDVPYPLFSFTGLLPWTYFASALGNASTAMVANANLLTKVYFPRIILPLAAVLSSLIDFVLAFGVLLLMLAWYGIGIGPAIVLVVPVIAFTALCALAAALWLATMSVRYRDVRFITPFLLQLWMFASPVVYASTAVPERLRFAYQLNPLCGLIDAFRRAVLGRGDVPWIPLALSLAATALVFITGAVYFRRFERTFADLV